MAIFHKLFDKFEIVRNNCQAFQNAYNKMASRLVNNNRRYNQNKHYKIVFQETMLDKLPAAYTSLVATMNNKSTNYTFTDLLRTIYKIK